MNFLSNLIAQQRGGIEPPYSIPTQYSPTQYSRETPFVGILSIICAFGLIGNVIVIFIVLVAKEYKKSVTNW